MMFKDDLEKYLGIKLNKKQEEQFEKYYNFLIEYNKNVNLTRIIERKEVYYKHFYDSLTLVQTINFKDIKNICDMGSGAGFPSIPLKIIYPNLDITIIDSLKKRITFLEELGNLLDLSPLTLIHDRVEMYALTHQNAFDLVTARALGNLQLITEMGLPMTKKDGRFVAYKGLNYEKELNESLNCIKQLGGKIMQVRTFELPDDFGHRVHIVIDKIKYIDGYPRPYIKMINNPL